ncbi:mRNA export factor GLE1 isoform X2 [Clarias gariepinus]|uniref:mRNA export factor GLE1 isoform X2 n=1 Tax=Clarias gariepinus TaxID=13013 RepID=UPI00234C8CA9|nr:mRNA export factor GLE1 isoform X2 [Clarias gariepinus]
MAPKKKKKAEASGGAGKEADKEAEAERQAQLHKEYEILNEIFRNLKRKADQLRKDNEILQNETNQIRIESQEYVSYMSKQAQKREDALAVLSKQREQKLGELSKEREEMVEKHKEQVNELNKEILEKGAELEQLNFEIAEHENVQRLQQQQLGSIAELEQELASARCRHSETLQALKASSLREKERYQVEAKHKVRELTFKVNKVSEENHRLHQELQQMIQRVRALRSRQELLETQRRQLLLEKEYARELQHLRASTR